jgi:hypothetical protein
MYVPNNGFIECTIYCFMSHSSIFHPNGIGCWSRDFSKGVLEHHFKEYRCLTIFLIFFKRLMQVGSIISIGQISTPFFVYGIWRVPNPNGFKGLLNGHLDSPQSKFQISNYHLPCRKLGFFSINTFMCVLNQGAHTYFFKKKYFGKKLEWV